MLFSDILGLDHIKRHLTATADRGRIPHAQLFVGSHGSGTLPMAIAYAQYLLCQNCDGKNNTGSPACNKKFQHLNHPDLHFSFPSANNARIKSRAKAMDFMKEWQDFVLTTPYGSLFDWYQSLGIANKQGKIGLDDAKDITQSLSLKAYEGGYKVMIIWHAELMNIRTANYLLKLIEEPPAKTVFILITEDESQILQTIRSRCQKLVFPKLGEEIIKNTLIERFNCSADQAQRTAFQADGNYARALQLLNETDEDNPFEKWFITWVRTAFKAKGNKGSIIKLFDWAEEIAASGRETQKQFLNYCLDFMRQALLLNYKADRLVYLQPKTPGFKLENFAPFIHGGNIREITKAIEDAIYHIERNGNSKLILSDLSIQLTRLIHKKEQVPSKN